MGNKGTRAMRWSAEVASARVDSIAAPDPSLSAKRRSCVHRSRRDVEPSARRIPSAYLPDSDRTAVPATPRRVAQPAIPERRFLAILQVPMAVVFATSAGTDWPGGRGFR